MAVFQEKRKVSPRGPNVIRFEFSQSSSRFRSVNTNRGPAFFHYYLRYRIIRLLSYSGRIRKLRKKATKRLTAFLESYCNDQFFHLFIYYTNNCGVKERRQSVAESVPRDEYKRALETQVVLVSVLLRHRLKGKYVKIPTSTTSFV